MTNDALKINENGHIHVKNISAYWIPKLTTAEVIAGTLYTVTGNYEGPRAFAASWSVLPLKILPKSWRILNDKRPCLCYNEVNQSCTDSCSLEGGYRNVWSNE